MFSPEAIWRMNSVDGKQDGQYCEHCLEPMQGFYLIENAKVCYTCKFDPPEIEEE